MLGVTAGASMLEAFQRMRERLAPNICRLPLRCRRGTHTGFNAITSEEQRRPSARVCRMRSKPVPQLRKSTNTKRALAATRPVDKLFSKPGVGGSNGFASLGSPSLEEAKRRRIELKAPGGEGVYLAGSPGSSTAEGPFEIVVQP